MVDNRTEPIFQDTNCTNSVNLGLTSLCTMRCPACSVSVPQYKAQNVSKHALVDEIVKDAAYMRGLKRIHLTGGEPTMHPQFEQIATSIRKWFDPQYMTIESNGTGYFKYRKLFELFDRVFITHYVKDRIYPGNFDNTSVIECAQRDLGEKLIREEPVTHLQYHSPVAELNVKPCSKWYNPGLPAGWYHSRLYSCCVTFGIDRGLGIPVTPDWKEKITELDMGCGRCLYRGT